MNVQPIKNHSPLRRPRLHTEYVMAGSMNAAQEWVLRPRKVAMMRCRTWAAANLRQDDAVILETTGNV